MTDYDYLCIICATIIGTCYGGALLLQQGKASTLRFAYLASISCLFGTLGVVVGKFVCVHLMQ